MKKKMFLILFMVMAIMLSAVGCTSNDSSSDNDNDYDGGGRMGKPVIYLYPTKTTDVDVYLQYDGKSIYTYPAYNDGWKVTANPDGSLINHSDNQEYSYLFWEGTSDIDYDMSKGFVVKGEDTEKFLKEKLKYLGLLPKEYNEFIVYWAPKMINNQYNLITFQEEVYTDNVVLTVNPKPDNIQRVFMAYKPLENYVEIEEQQLSPFERSGFTVIEWGGTIIE